MRKKIAIAQAHAQGLKCSLTSNGPLLHIVKLVGRRFMLVDETQLLCEKDDVFVDSTAKRGKSNERVLMAVAEAYRQRLKASTKLTGDLVMIHVHDTEFGTRYVLGEIPIYGLGQQVWYNAGEGGKPGYAPRRCNGLGD